MIQFDTAKDARNITKHGISLAMAERLEWDLLLAWEDTREGYVEKQHETQTDDESEFETSS